MFRNSRLLAGVVAVVAAFVAISGPESADAKVGKKTVIPKPTKPGSAKATTKRVPDSRLALITTRVPSSLAPAPNKASTQTPTRAPTQAAAPAASLLAPATTATTAPSVTTTTPPTTTSAATAAATTTTTTASTAAPTSVPPTAPAAGYDYGLRVSIANQTVVPGKDFTVFIIADPKVGPLQPVTLLPTNIPSGVSMVLDQNPMVGAAQLRVTIPQFVSGGTYEFTMTGTSGGVSRSVVVGFVITPPTTTTTTVPPTTVASSSTVTTVATIVRPAFKFSLIISGVSGTLTRGGSVSVTITATREPGNNDKIALSTTDLPKNVWSGFSSAEVITTSTLWLSSTEPLVAGSYTFNLVVSSAGYSQSIPIALNLA